MSVADGINLLPKLGFELTKGTEEKEAWVTFSHEITEYKLQAVTRPYRILINNLIEAVEKSVYAEKEQFIDFLPKMVESIKQSQKSEVSKESTLNI